MTSSCLLVRVPSLRGSRGGREEGGWGQLQHREPGRLPAGQLVSLQREEEGRERLRATGAELSLVDLGRGLIQTKQP